MYILYIWSLRIDLSSDSELKKLDFFPSAFPHSMISDCVIILHLPPTFWIWDNQAYLLHTVVFKVDKAFVVIKQHWWLLCYRVH